MAKIKNYDEEFRRNAVELLYSSRKPLSQVARELGVAAATLHAWKGKYGRFGLDGNGSGGSPVEGLTVEQILEENRRLRKEVQYLERQRDILKKAALILGEDPR
jgi:transposase